MRPENNFHHHHHHQHNQEPRLINGPRPAPLKISKESHLIHKMSSSSSSSSSSSIVATQQQQQQRSHPVIIYTQSPKVIHTQPRDFMALVQKLTGNSSTKAPIHQEQDQDHHDAKADNNESSSAVTTKNIGGSGDAMSPILNPPKIANFADIPLFTPNSSNLFASPRPVYRFPDSAYPSPNMGYSFSPSVFEFFKGLPE